MDGVVFETTGLEARALDTNEMLWSWTDAPSEDGERRLTPPAVCNGRVLIGTWNGRLVSLDAYDGRVRWDVAVGAPRGRSGFWPRSVTDWRSLRAAFNGGYTSGMKTAVSIPDDVFEKVERLARRGQRSRSEVFSAALAEYVARHAPDEVTDAMNRVLKEVAGEDVQPDAFVRTAGRRVLEKTEW
jgi:predicted transcriptional regulator